MKSGAEVVVVLLTCSVLKLKTGKLKEKKPTTRPAYALLNSLLSFSLMLIFRRKLNAFFLLFGGRKVETNVFIFLYQFIIVFCVFVVMNIFYFNNVSSRPHFSSSSLTLNVLESRKSQLSCQLFLGSGSNKKIIFPCELAKRVSFHCVMI